MQFNLQRPFDLTRNHSGVANTDRGRPPQANQKNENEHAGLDIWRPAIRSLHK